MGPRTRRRLRPAADRDLLRNLVIKLNSACGLPIGSIELISTVLQRGLASKVLSDVFDSLVRGKSVTCRILLGKSVAVSDRIVLSESQGRRPEEPMLILSASQRLAAHQ